MFGSMKINFLNVIYIFIAASIIGLVINYIRPDSLPFIRESRNLVWADSLNMNDKIHKDSTKINHHLSVSKDSIEKKDTVNSLFKNNIALKNKKEDSKKIKRESEVKPFKEPIAIKLDQAYRLFKQNITFIDARANEDYKAGHIKGALNLPYYNFDPYKKVLGKIPKDNIIVTYCAGSECDLSILLGKQLFEMGYKRVYIFFDGWNEWEKAKYPTESTNN